MQSRLLFRRSALIDLPLLTHRHSPRTTSFGREMGGSAAMEPSDDGLAENGDPHQDQTRNHNVQHQRQAIGENTSRLESHTRNYAKLKR